MKKLLDRLMARQARLMDSLGPPADTPSRRSTQPVPPAELQARREAELRDVETAFSMLESGDLLAAAALLAAHADKAQETRTLTTLARIRSMQGDFEGALEFMKRADALDPSDIKVAYFMARLLELNGQHQSAIHYRRRVAFSKTDMPAAAYIALIGAIVKATPGGRKPPAGELRVALDRLRAAPDLDTASRLEAATLLFKVKAFQPDAQRLLTEAAPCPPSALDAASSWQTVPAWCQASGTRLHRDVESGRPALRHWVAELTDAVVHPQLHWLPQVDEGRVLFSGIATGRIRTRDESPSSPLLLDDGRTALLRVPRDVPQVDTQALLVGGVGHYFHDTVEYIGSLCVAESLGEVGALPLVVGADLAPHLRELLALLGYDDTRLILVNPDRPARFARLRVPSRPLAGGRWVDPALPAWCRRRLVGKAGPSRPTRKLYVSRQRTARRRIDNDETVMSALGSLGYERVEPESLSVRQQVDLFSQASHIVGASGAALTNLLYVPESARVVVLHNRQAVKVGADLYYDALAAACGHEVSVLDCAVSRLEAGRNAIDADLVVDIDRLRELLR